MDTGEVSILDMCQADSSIYLEVYFFICLHFCFLKKVRRKQLWVQPLRPVYKHVFKLFSTHVKKGQQKAILGTATIVLGFYGYHRDSLNSYTQGGCDCQYCSWVFWVPRIAELMEYLHRVRMCRNVSYIFMSYYLTQAVSSPTSDPGKAVLFGYVHMSVCPFVCACSKNLLDRFCWQMFCCDTTRV